MRFGIAGLAGALMFLAGGAFAQDENESRAASPRDLTDWARQIQMDYPTEALRNGDDGTVTMRILIGADGIVQECEVTESSGSSVLDAGACRGMQDHARYSPARNTEGEPIASTSSQSIRYILPDGAPEVDRFEPPIFLNRLEVHRRIFDEDFTSAISASSVGKVLFALTIDTTGKPTGCGIMASSGDGSLDMRTCEGLVENAEFLPSEAADGSKIPGFYAIPYPGFEAFGSVRAR